MNRFKKWLKNRLLAFLGIEISYLDKYDEEALDKVLKSINNR